jgi:hypothetical protein
LNDSGSLVLTVKNELDKRHMNLEPDDGRSDDKGSEPESVVVAKWVQNILFVGLERTDNCMIYDVTNQMHRLFTNLKTGDAQKVYFYSRFKVRRKKFSNCKQ